MSDDRGRQGRAGGGRSSGIGEDRGKRVGPAPGPGKQTLTGALGVQPAPAGNRSSPLTRDVCLPQQGGGHDDATGPTEASAGPSGGDHVAATVVGACAANETAIDGFFTPALLAALGARPDQSLDEVLWQLAASPPQQHGYAPQHPSVFQFGQTPQAGAAGAPRKQAVLIGNQHYQSMPRLRTPIAETVAMKSALEARGYHAEAHFDQTAPTMGSAWDAMVGAARPGDDLVAFFGGHGMPEGLVGIQHDSPDGYRDLFSNERVTGVVSTATDKGAHIRFVMDSCFSGAAVRTVRTQRAERTTPELMKDPARLAMRTQLSDARQRVAMLCSRRSAILNQVAVAGARTRTAVTSTVMTRDIGAMAGGEIPPSFLNALARAMERVWDLEIVPVLDAVRAAIKYDRAPPKITEPQMAAQLAYIDQLQDAVLEPGTHSIAGRKDPHEEDLP